MTTRTNKGIETRAADLLRETNCFAIPVAVDKVAYRLGLAVEAAELGDDVSGILVVKNESGTIGYNESQAPVRQRFSIAHEIGHYVLHREHERLFIDKSYSAVFRRDQNSSTGEDLREIQANQFAAALLMPEELLAKEIAGFSLDLGDELALTALASRFQVSSQAMSLRLAHLGILAETE
jgi:Zn-dependent peptidase ImmA (M78 family)